MNTLDLIKAVLNDDDDAKLALVSALLSGDYDGAVTPPSVGRYCIVRCRDAGVHAGMVESANVVHVPAASSILPDADPLV